MNNQSGKLIYLVAILLTFALFSSMVSLHHNTHNVWRNFRALYQNESRKFDGDDIKKHMAERDLAERMTYDPYYQLDRFGDDTYKITLSEDFDDRLILARLHGASSGKVVFDSLCVAEAVSQFSSEDNTNNLVLDTQTARSGIAYGKGQVTNFKVFAAESRAENFIAYLDNDKTPSLYFIDESLLQGGTCRKT